MNSNRSSLKSLKIISPFWAPWNLDLQRSAWSLFSLLSLSISMTHYWDFLQRYRGCTILWCSKTLTLPLNFLALIGKFSRPSHHRNEIILIQCDVLIPFREFEDQSWSKAKNEAFSKNLCEFMRRVNALSHWVATCLILPEVNSSFLFILWCFTSH